MTLTPNALSPRRLHPVQIRIMHWINAAAMILMIGSAWGIYDDSVIIHGLHFDRAFRIGTWAAGEPELALYGMWLLMANGLAYLLYGIVTGRFRERLLPIRVADIVATVRETLPAALRSCRSHDLQRRAEAALHRRHPRRRVAGGHGLSQSGNRFSSAGWCAARRLPRRATRSFHGNVRTGRFLLVHVALSLLVPRTLWAMLAGGPTLPPREARS